MHTRNGGWVNWSMILVEEYDCQNKLALLQRERHWIEQLPSKLNSIMPWISITEHKERRKLLDALNKDKITAQTKLHYALNKDKKLLQSKERYEVNKETIKIKRKLRNQANKDLLKHQYEQNKDKLNAKRRERRKAKKEV